MATEIHICDGQVQTGPLLNEPMQVATVPPNGLGVWVMGFVGRDSERFRKVTLTSDDIANRTVADGALPYDGDWWLLGIASEAFSLGDACRFDSSFDLSISRAGPLPHQLEADYDYLLSLPGVHFLLADHATARKTTMTDLLVREFKPWGLSERVLVDCPERVILWGQRSSPGTISFPSNLCEEPEEIAQSSNFVGLGSLRYASERYVVSAAK